MENAENVQGIHDLLARLGPAERTALDYRDVDGRPHLTHWYVMLAGTRE